MELSNFQTSFNCHWLELLRTAPLPINKVIIIAIFYDGINRMYLYFVNKHFLVGHFWDINTFTDYGSMQFFLFSSTGRRPASLCHGPLSVVRPSVRALTFSLNIFFAETTYRILMKFHRNVPTMVLFRISWNNLIPSKSLVAMATKLKFFWNLWKSSCQKP